MLKNKERWLVKAGSSLIAGKNEGVNQTFIKNLVYQVNELRSSNIDVVIVTSGAVAKGMYNLGLSQRPSSLHLLQATAAVGQLGLINNYQLEFDKFNIQAAQVLISHDDIRNRQRYLNVRSSLQTLIGLGVVPVVNENDSVSTQEISFGDNDTLAGSLAALINADKFIMLTDQLGVCTADPRLDGSAELIEKIDIDDIDIHLTKILEGISGVLGRGGIKTKIKAAKLALDSGSMTWVADGREKNTLLSILNERKIGTSIISQRTLLPSRKQWIASLGSPEGQLNLDGGAVIAINSRGGSLLPIGIVKVAGDFKRGSLLQCIDPEGNEVARGLSNFDSKEINAILGLKSSKISKTLGYSSDEEVIHRDNLVLS